MLPPGYSLSIMDLGVLDPDTWRVAIVTACTVYIVTVLGWVAGMVVATRTPLVVGDGPVNPRALRLHSLTFVNASLIAPSLAAMLVLSLAAPRRDSGVVDALGLVFLASYVTMNTAAYTSQYALLPRLVGSRDPAAAGWLFESPTSLPYGLAMLGYACFGLAAFALAPGMIVMDGAWRLAGAALLASGATSVLGYAGYALRRRGLEQMTVVGGGIALLVGPLTLAGALAG